MADGFDDNPFLRYLRQPGSGPTVPAAPRSTIAQDTFGDGLGGDSDNPFLRHVRPQAGSAPASGAGGIGSYVSTALAPQDVAFRYGARHLFGIPVSDDATAAQALTSGLGLRQGGEGYGKNVLRSGIEFGADIGLNPMTYAIPGEGAIAKAATAGFTGMAGAGFAQKVPQIYQDIKAHGFTPEVAGELTSAGLEAAGAGLGAAHLIHGFKAAASHAVPESTPVGEPATAPAEAPLPTEAPVPLDPLTRGGERRVADAVTEIERRVADRRSEIAARHGIPEDHPLVDEAARADVDPVTGVLGPGAHARDLPNFGGHASLDLSRVKFINDKFGHGAGDQFLHQSAQTMGAAVEGLGGRFYRRGGDEFAIGAADEAGASNMAKAAKEALAASEIEYVGPDGGVVDTFRNPRVDYGYAGGQGAEGFDAADKHLIAYRQRAEALPPDHPEFRQPYRVSVPNEPERSGLPAMAGQPAAGGDVPPEAPVASGPVPVPPAAPVPAEGVSQQQAAPPVPPPSAQPPAETPPTFTGARDILSLPESEASKLPLHLQQAWRRANRPEGGGTNAVPESAAAARYAVAPREPESSAALKEGDRISFTSPSGQKLEGRVQITDMGHSSGKPAIQIGGIAGRDLPMIVTHEHLDSSGFSVLEDPQFRASEQGAPPAAPTKPLTAERVKAAIPLDFTQHEDGSFRATLANGETVRVTETGKIEVGNEAKLAESAEAGGVENPQPVGSYQQIGKEHIILLAKEAPAETPEDKTLIHEGFHLAFKFLSPKKQAAVLGKYGNEEKAAYAYSDWNPAKQTNSWFSEILAFAKRLYRNFKPTWESVFEETREGRVLKQGEVAPVSEPPAAPAYATAPSQPPSTPEPSLTDRLKEAALGTGGRTSAKPGAGGEREGPINLDRLNTPDDVRQLHDRLTTAALPEIGRGKGRMTLAEIKAAGEEILGKGQFDERRLEKMQRENSALNSAQMTAARMLNQSAVDRLMEAGKAHDAALKDPHADPTRTEDALNAAVLKWKGIGLATLGRQAEAARTLAAHNIFVEGLNPEQRMLHEMMKQNGVAMADADVRELVLAAAKGDRKAVQDAARKALTPSWFDKFYEVYVNGLISGPATHIANNASNTTMQAAGVVKRLLAAGIEQVRSKIQGQAPERFVDDTYADLRGMKRGMTSAFEPDSPYSFSTAIKGGAAGGKLEINRLGAIPGKLGEVVRFPGTALEAEDKVFKSMSFFREAYVRAGRKARGEATNRNMTGADLESYVSKRRDEIVDSIDTAYRDSTKAGKSYSGPFKDVFEPAEKAARYDTFQKEAGPILAAITKLREADPTGIFKIVMPFLRTPANIAKVTIEHTPLKVFDVLSKARKGELKGGEISDELAKPLFGALLALPVVYAAKEGMLTGSGPTDPKERELWRATGAQPNSVVVPIDGKLTYISYGRLEPISTLMTMAVDFNEAADAKSRGTAADKIVGTVLNAVNDKTFLAGLSDLVLAWHDPKRYASTLIKDTAGNLVPASSLMRATAHAIDPVVRERVSVLDAAIANIPGLSQTLPAKPTGTGIPIERQHPVISSLTPFSTSEERPENRIERLMLDLDFHPSTPQRILTIPGSHGRKVELTRDEFAAFEKADNETTTRLQGLVDRLKRLPPEEQKAFLERSYSDSARRVRERLYGTSSFRERARTAMDAAKQERLQAGAP